MRNHEAKAIITEATGLPVFNVDGGFEVFVDGEHPELVEPTAAALRAAGVPFTKKRSRKRFKGATYSIPVRNVGDAFNARLEWAA